ncbi:DUF1549 domain-containing protein [Humisphaera borealis]|uniref:DUF1549 domain-containing protein n=1 Tax=Humisphaera borealis TaxID=2807512 RepID=A0A7M2X1X7_9BACT|nr:DUF1549 domain-containing protein [Humisphaera borealis]QOV91713.1 DUF1549 domain-containing protein [Humisphaera borealis]
MSRSPLHLTLCLLVAALALDVRAEAPLHERIDAAVESHAAANKIAVAPPADDAEFLRRLYLDLTGTLPTVDEARAFLADKDPAKRQKLIDKLLADDRFPRRMAEAMTVMFMERRLAPDKPEIEQFESYLRGALAANKPADQIVAEMLSPTPDDEATRGATIFLAKRLENYGQNPVDYPMLTRDVGRMFLGVDLQCAQCHNHLTVREYKQSDFQGLFAFVGHSYLRKDVSYPAVGEKLVDKKIEFASVFAGEKREIGPRLPAMEEVSIPVFDKGQEWQTPPDKAKKSLGVPKFSPLKVLSQQLPTAQNPLFKRNMANRLWYLMVGRGVVHPLDLHHKDNPPSVAALLDVLAEDFASSGFDIKRYVREIALSRTYQRSSRLPEAASGQMPQPGSFAVAPLKRLSPEQLLHASLMATGDWEKVSSRRAEPAATKPVAAADADVEETESPAKKGQGKPLTLKELRKKFVTAFAAPAGEPEIEFSPTVAAALFVLNDDSTLEWLTRRDGNLIDRLAKIDDSAKVAEELYLSVLTRMPTDEERADVAGHLTAKQEPGGSAAGNRDRAIGELVWSLLASTEFAVNH